MKKDIRKCIDKSKKCGIFRIRENKIKYINF